MEGKKYKTISMDEWRDGRTELGTDIMMDWQSDGYMNGWIYGVMDRRMDWWRDELMEVMMDGRNDGRMHW